VLPSSKPNFEPAERACLHLADACTDDRSEWAASALRTFSAKTGSGLEEEGVGDLIADLGHYADLHKIDFLDVVRAALANRAVERRGVALRRLASDHNRNRREVNHERSQECQEHCLQSRLSPTPSLGDVRAPVRGAVGTRSRSPLADRTGHLGRDMLDASDAEG
jgi:hypothetical protein